MIKQWGEWINARQFHAGIVAFVCVMSTFIYLPGTFIASIVLAFVTLRNGAKFGAVVLAWVAIPAIAFAVRGHFSAFGIAWVHCFVVYIAALTLRNTHRWNDVLLVLTLVGCAVVMAAHGFIPDVNAVWHSVLTRLMGTLTASQSVPSEYWPRIIDLYSRIGTGVVTSTLMIFMFLELMIARYWQSIIYNPGALKVEMLKLRIHRWVSLILPIAVILAFITHNTVLIDMMPVILFPFIVEGLIVLHAAAVAKPNWRFMVPVAYVATFVFTYFICLWALIGFLDGWVKFPSRIKAFEILEKGEK